MLHLHFYLGCTFLNLLQILLHFSYFVVLLGAVTGRRQRTAKLPNREFTLFLEVANLSKAIRKRCLRGACTLRWRPRILVALRIAVFPRAPAVVRFWQLLGGCGVLRAPAVTPPAVSCEAPYDSAPVLKGHGGLSGASALVCCE